MSDEAVDTPQSPTTVSVNATSTAILAANAGRRGAYITNLSDVRISLALGHDAVDGQGIPLAAQTDSDNPGGSVLVLTTAAVNGISRAGNTKAVAVQEW